MMKKPSLSAFQSFISQLRPPQVVWLQAQPANARRTVYIACGGAAIIIALILIFARPPQTTAMQPEQSGQTLDIPGQKTVQIDGQHVVQGSAGAQPTINAAITPTPTNEYLAATAPSPTPGGDVLDAALPTPTPTPTAYGNAHSFRNA